MRYLLWDFDGTLGHRVSDSGDGARTASMLEVLDNAMSPHTVTLDQIRPFLQTGFPWQEADRPHLQSMNTAAARSTTRFIHKIRKGFP